MFEIEDGGCSEAGFEVFADLRLSRSQAPATELEVETSQVVAVEA